MRALAIHCESDEFSSQRLTERYVNVQRRSPVNKEADTPIFQYTFMSFQNLSALDVMVEADYPSDLVRSAIVTWYYGLYCSASAMLAAADGSVREDHRGTANSWDRQLVQNELVPFPFNLRVPSLVKKDCEHEIERLRNGNAHTGDQLPTGHAEATGACLSFLNGTAQYEREQAEQRVKTFKQFKNLEVHDFRKKTARDVRDDYLNRKAVGFLHQAFRYRGKANYRDALYLGYGTEYTSSLKGLLQDLYSVLLAFITTSVHYCSRRAEKHTWSKFVRDLELNSRLKLSTEILKV